MDPDGRALEFCAKKCREYTPLGLKYWKFSIMDDELLRRIERVLRARGYDPKITVTSPTCLITFDRLPREEDFKKI